MGIRLLEVFFVCLALYLVVRLVWRQRTPFPPGPQGWPLIGTLLDTPNDAIYKALGPMSVKYGPLMSITLMGRRFVVLNSHKVAKDLLEKKSVITSNKPHITMASDLVGWGNSTPFLQYGDAHRKHRKLFHQQIGTKNSLRAFYPIKEAETKRLLCNILRNPDDLIAHCYRMANAVILKISHGYTVEEDDDPLVKMANKVMEMFVIVTTPGRFLVDIIPALRYLPEWIPGGGFHKDAKLWRKLLMETLNTPHEFVLGRLAKGDAVPSVTSRLLQEGVTPEGEEILKWVSLSMYLGGSDTAPNALSAFFLAMTIFPDIFKKAQAEVDTVVGNERLPTMDDREVLPYVNAICMELLRWHVAAPHTTRLTTEDITYDGYFIPKGTSFLGNLWYILSDPNAYPNPDVFNPERFLGEDQQLDPREVCFGYGRRVCPGAQLVDMTLFACVAMALATVNVSRCVENGVECVPKYDVKEGSIRHIKPFKCQITPRSKKAEDLLQG